MTDAELDEDEASAGVVGAASTGACASVVAPELDEAVAVALGVLRKVVGWVSPTSIVIRERETYVGSSAVPLAWSEDEEEDETGDEDAVEDTSARAVSALTLASASVLILLVEAGVAGEAAVLLDMMLMRGW